MRAVEETVDVPGCGLETVIDIDLVFEFAFRVPLAHFLDRLTGSIHVVHDDKAFDTRPLDQDHREGVGAWDRLGGVITGDQTADHDPRALVDPLHLGVEDLTADIFEDHVDAVRAVLVELADHAFGLVVDGGVEVELLGEPGALGVAAGDAHHPTADDLSDLADDGSHRSGGAGDDQCLAGLRFAHVEEPEVGGQTDHAKEPEVGGQGQRPRLDHPQPGAIRDAVVLPADRARDDVAFRETIVSRGLDDPDGEPSHDVAELHGFDIGRSLANPAAVGGVEREVDVAHQHLAVLDGSQRLLQPLKIAVLDEPLGSGGESPLAVDAIGHEVLLSGPVGPSW